MSLVGHVVIKRDGTIDLPSDTPDLEQFGQITFANNAFNLPAPYIVPLTTSPNQVVSVNLGAQACSIHVYTKSLYVPIAPPQEIVTDPPVYENQNPVFLDLYVNDALLLGGVLCLNYVPMVRNTYLGFVGDLVMIDVSGNNADPVGVPARLPPRELMNQAQLALPLSYQGYSPDSVAGTIPGLGSRFLLTYWPELA